MKNTLALFITILSFSAFAQSSGSHWKALYVWQGYEMANVSAKKSDILISIADKKLSGTVGCNNFHGNLDYLKGDKIKPIKVVNAKDKCPETPDKLDSAVLEALKVSTKLVINQDRAKFYHGEKLLLELKR